MYKILINLFLLSSVFCMDDVTVDLVTPIHEYGEACGYMACPVENTEALNIHVVAATHGELGISRTFYEHYTGLDDIFGPRKINMKNTLDSVITELWANERRKFTFSDMPYFFHWWKNRDGTVRRMVYQLLRQGRLYFAGGGWGISDEATANYHAIIDQYTYSLRKINATFLECGRPLVTWQVDNYGHSREYASLMAQMGFDGHFINPISYDDEIARMREKSLEFVWRGSDDLGPDTDIFTHKLFDGYWTPPGFCFGSLCTDPLIVLGEKIFENGNERVEEFTKLMLERQGPYYTTKHVMVIMGHRHSYYDADIWFSNIDRLIRAVNSKQRNEKNRLFMYYSTPACYLKAIQKAQPGLKNKQDDFFPMAYDQDTHATGSFTSRPSTKLMAREMHLFLQIAKQLQVFGRLANNDNKFEDILWMAGTAEKFLKRAHPSPAIVNKVCGNAIKLAPGNTRFSVSLTRVIHDHAILAGAMRQKVTEYYVAKVHRAKLICLQIYRQAFNNLRNSSKTNTYYMCPFNVSSCWPLSGDRGFIVVYNPLAWRVTLPIRLPVDRTYYHLYDPKGQKVNHTIISIPEIVKSIPERKQRDHNPSLDDELVFLAENLPPMGFRSYYLEQRKTRTKRFVGRKITKNKRVSVRQANLNSNQNGMSDYVEYEFFDDTTYDPGANSTEKQLMNQDSTLTPTSEATTSTSTTKAPTTTRAPTTRRATSPATSSTTTDIPYFYEVPQVTTTTMPDYNEVLEDNSTYVDDLESSHEYSFRRMEKTGYFSSVSGDRYIENEYVRINLNRGYSKTTSMVLSNGVAIYLEVQMMWYISDDPDKMGTTKPQPGSYVFRPMDPTPELISVNPTTTVIKTEALQEIHMQLAPYAGLAFRVYKSLPYVEVDWVVGPIPVEDGFGKEIFVRYNTDLKNNGVFYTDANGRQTIKRIKNSRGTYVPTTDDNVSGNVYPVTSKVYIEDTERNIRFSVFTDRGEGCTSLDQGQLDLMLHRRVLTVDSGVLTFVNETQFGEGLVVRGKHHLYLSKADYRPNRVFEKKLAKELYLQPQVFTSTHPYYLNMSFVRWRQSSNEFSALRKKLPIGVHILTIEQWHKDLLIRLENYLESTDVVRNGLKTVFIDELFVGIKLFSCKETLLAANKWKEGYIKMMWKTNRFLRSFNDAYGNASNAEYASDYPEPTYEVVKLSEGIKLAPQQIRTFVCKYEDLAVI